MVGPTQDLQGRTTLGFGTEAKGWVPPLPALLFATPHLTFALFPLSQPDAGSVWWMHLFISLLWTIQAQSCSPLPSVLDSLCCSGLRRQRKTEEKQDEFCVIFFFFFFCCCGGRCPRTAALSSDLLLCRDLRGGGKMLGQSERQHQKCVFGSFTGQILCKVAAVSKGKRKMYKSPVFQLVVNRSCPREETFSVLLVGLSQVTEG